jgi:TRAP-type mannitol/chloroaromatic compound transport system permease large subunit
MLYVLGARAMRRHGAAAAEGAAQRAVGTILFSLLTSFVPLATLIFCVLGAILFGLATPPRPRRWARSAR